MNSSYTYASVVYEEWQSEVFNGWEPEVTAPRAIVASQVMELRETGGCNTRWDIIYE